MPTYPTTFSLSGWDEMNQLLQQRQQQANVGRIPGAESLELQSSADIAQLLNPPAMFADVNRQAAEVGAARGIGGSAAAAATGYRMTDEERLRRMALGQQMLTAAYARNPSADLLNPAQFTVTPYQQAQLDMEEERLRLAREQWDWRVARLNQPSVNYQTPEQFGLSSGARPSGAGNRVTADMLADPSIYRQLATTGMYTPELSTEDLISGWAPAEGGYAGGAGWGQVGDQFYDYSQMSGWGTPYDYPPEFDMPVSADVYGGGYDYFEPGTFGSEDYFDFGDFEY